MRSAAKARFRIVTSAARPGLPLGNHSIKQMSGSATPLSVLGSQCEDERARIRKGFESGASAKETLHALCELADRSIQQVFKDVLKLRDSGAEGFSLLALGGYGRRMLFPYSVLDILFLFSNDKTEEELSQLIP